MPGRPKLGDCLWKPNPHLIRHSGGLRAFMPWASSTTPRTRSFVSTLSDDPLAGTGNDEMPPDGFSIVSVSPGSIGNATSDRREIGGDRETESPMTAGFTVDSFSGPCVSATGQVDATSDARSNSNESSLQPGTRVGYFGDYELLKVLGEGGMGIVYKARQLSLNRPVAFKMIKASRFASADEVRRFQNEAEAVARLDHPNIVPIFEVGECEDQHYFSMKLIAGDSLDKRLKDYLAEPSARPSWWRSWPARSTTPTSAASSTAT